MKKKPNLLQVSMLLGYVAGFMLILQGMTYRGITLIFVTYAAITLLRTTQFNKGCSDPQNNHTKVFTIYSRGLSKYIVVLLGLVILGYFIISGAPLWDIVSFGMAILIGVLDLALSVNFFHLSPGEMIFCTPSFINRIDKGQIVAIKTRDAYIDLQLKDKEVSSYAIGPFIKKDMDRIKVILEEHYQKKLKGN